MKKTLFCLCSLLLCAAALSAGTLKMDSLLERLDDVIRERARYIDQKEARLRKLKQGFYAGMPREERFERCDSLLV